MKSIFSILAFVSLVNFAQAGSTSDGMQNLVWCDTCHKFVPAKPMERSLKDGLVAQQPKPSAPPTGVKAQSGHN